MFEENNEPADGMNQQENETLEEINLDGTEDTEALTAKLKEERELRIKETQARKELTARAKRAEEEARIAKSKLPSLQEEKPKIEEQVVKDVAELKMTEKKRQFGYSHGLSPEETDTLFNFANGSDPDLALKNPFFQAGLDGMRRKKANEANTPSSSNRAPIVGGKTFGQMTQEERKANWGTITNAITKK